MSEVDAGTENPEAIATTDPVAGETVLVGQTAALSLLLGMRAFTRFSDRVYLGMGWVCGLELLLLGLFITYQVIARKLGWFQVPATDVMSGYALAMAATWAFAYSLRTGSHVRIDVLLPFMGRKVRALADWLALAAIGFFASVVAWKMWVTIINNYERGVVTNDYPITPLWIPKIVVGVGFSLLAFAAIQMMTNMLAEWLLPQLHKLMGGTEVPAEQVVVTDVPPTV